MNAKLNIKRFAVELAAATLLLTALIPGAAGAIEVGKPAADFSLTTLDGKNFTLSTAKGKKGVALAFFATWCGPCMAEVPHLKELAQYLIDKDVVLIGVNDEGKELMEKFAKDKNINYRILLDDGGLVGNAYQVKFIPMIVGIDGNGVVRYSANEFPKDVKAFVEMLSQGVVKDAAPVAAAAAPAALPASAKPEAAPAKPEAPAAQTPAPAAADPRDGTDHEADGVKFISKETLQKWLAADPKPLVIDVLGAESYAKSHLKGSVSIPLEKLEAAAAKLDKQALTVVYCAGFSCHASVEAAKKLQALGFANVHDYKGGLADWSKAGLPMEKAE